MIGISLLVSHEVCIRVQYFFWSGEKCGESKKRLKIQEKNRSCERALNFYQRKTFSENYKPMGVLLWLVHKFTENCRSRLFPSSFILKKSIVPLLIKYLS